MFLFETRRHRPLILGMYIHLIGFHEVVQIIVLGSTTTTQKGSIVLHRLIRENWMYIHLIGLHEVVQIIVLGSTTTTQKGSIVLHRLIRENWIKISSCVKLYRRLRPSIFDMLCHLLDLYHDCSNYSPGVGNIPTQGHLFCIASYKETL